MSTTNNRAEVVARQEGARQQLNTLISKIINYYTKIISSEYYLHNYALTYAMATPHLLIWSSYWAPFLDGIGSVAARIYFETSMLSNARRYHLTLRQEGRYTSQKLNAQRISLYLLCCQSNGQYYGERCFVRGFTMVNRF